MGEVQVEVVRDRSFVLVSLLRISSLATQKNVLMFITLERRVHVQF